MRLRRSSTAGVALVALVVAATACTAGGSGNGGGDSSTLTVDTSFVIKSLDPGQVYEATGYIVVHAVYETLLTFEGSDVSKPVPALAKSYQASKDAKTFTFQLRDDATFSDGSAVTADDVVFSLDRLKNLKASPAVTVAALSFTKKDEHTVVVRSKRPEPNVPIILTTPPTGILNADVVREHGGKDGGKDGGDASKSDTAQKYLDEQSAGSGPYVLKSMDPSAEVVLAVNEKYWGDRPEFERVVLRNSEVQNQKLTMSRAKGNELALDLSGKLLEGLPDSLQQSGQEDTFYFLTLNADPKTSPVTANQKFVRAVRAAIDYEGVAELFGDDAGPAAGMVPPAFPGALPASEAQKQDLAEAKRLLAESGVDQPKVKLIYPSITYRGVDLGTVVTKVQRDVAKAGITLQLEPKPLASFLDTMRSAKTEMVFGPQSLNYPVAASLVNNFRPGYGSSLRSNWTVKRANQETVDASQAVLDATDPAAQRRAVQDWQRVMNEHSPFIPIAYNSGVVVASESLTGATYSPAGWQVDIPSVGRK